MASIPELVIPSPADVTIPVGDARHLKGWHWQSPNPRGILVIAHGLGEHGGLYRSFAEYLVPTIAIDVLVFDFLGHGRSPGRHGHVSHYDQLVDDVLAATRWAGDRHPGLPRFVLGHSNGGLASALAMLRDPDAADGLILSNPALRVKYKAPRFKVAIGHFLRAVAPWVTLSGPLPVEGLSRDPLQQVALRTDLLMHTRIGAPLFFGMRDGGIAALERAPEFRRPLLVLLGEDDPIIDPDAGRSFFERSGADDKSLHALPEFRHSPLFELDRGLVYRALADWIRARLSGRAQDNGAVPGCSQGVAG